ncbi:hypothetical protein [Yoonia sp. 2307UL14-13]|uniref:hypothetical protein n=1 Tax=Yoonia sp. 2307UL14-13 TaxID=3126506 RepID=UPI0030A2689B
MPGFVSVLLIGLTAAWLLMRHYVQRRLHALDENLPDIYQAAIVAPPDSAATGRLIPLAIDLLRKEETAVPFTALRPAERHIALLALAIEERPRWMVNLTKQRLSVADRRLVTTLQDVQTSRPAKRERHFGAIHAELQLRAARKT